MEGLGPILVGVFIGIVVVIFIGNLVYKRATKLTSEEAEIDKASKSGGTVTIFLEDGKAEIRFYDVKSNKSSYKVFKAIKIQTSDTEAQGNDAKVEYSDSFEVLDNEYIDEFKKHNFKCVIEKAKAAAAKSK